MDEQEENQHNMISNLPLLFANGYPTSLEKITEMQLENFIPFMVQCSLGHINLQGKMDYSEPEWWPEDLPFIVPFSKPKKFTGDWVEKMKEIVVICYQFHKSIFLLRFCNDLASYEHASLRFINNYNSTTSLFDRRSSKLLVTFRNENMSYDQPQRGRKCLLQQKAKNDRQTGVHSQQMMVEPAPFDIYLCDNCDAELYSKEAVLEHEKTCQAVDEDEEDDDVILCDTPEPCEVSQTDSTQTTKENEEQRNTFMLSLGLHNLERISNVKNEEASASSPSPSAAREESNILLIDRNRRMSRRNRTVHTLSRCPSIPLSSPAGQLLLRITKATVSTEYLSERLDRSERFCHTPLLSKSTGRPKFFDKKYSSAAPTCTFKKPQDYSSHIYTFPRRQFSQKRRRENLRFLNSSLLKRCRPISVRLKKIKRELPSTKLNMKLTRDTTRNSNWKVSSCSSEVIIDTIDLCSSDEETDCGRRNEPAPKSSVSTTTTAEKVVCSRTFTRTVTGSEISLIPLSRSLTNRGLDGEKQSSSPRIEHNTDEKYHTTSIETYSNQTSTSSASREATGLPKPLRPSLYIFSNYSTLIDSASEVATAENSTVFRSQNQENQVQSNTSSKRTTIATSTPASSWLPVTNNFTQNAQSESSSTLQTHLLDRERASRSISLAQKFGTPGRIVSIDLTS